LIFDILICGVFFGHFDLSVAISVKTMLCIPKESSWMTGLEDEIFAAVNMLVVPEFSQGFKHFGFCCDAGLDV
jgi:hypothetical protein